ncbi:MAG: hypothetical protein WDA02_07485 [Saccharofermentanales bacterium]
MKKFNQFINEGIKIDGLEYPISERDFEYMKNSGYSNFAYVNNNPDKWHDKKHIRVYNHITKQHFYLEKVWPEVGDNNLIFVDFPRTDAPTDSWSQHATQYAKVRSWGQSRDEHHGDFIRFKIIQINDDNYCKVDDGYNEQPSGWYARDSFYKINKIS